MVGEEDDERSEHLESIGSRWRIEDPSSEFIAKSDTSRELFSSSLLCDVLAFSFEERNSLDNFDEVVVTVMLGGGNEGAEEIAASRGWVCLGGEEEESFEMRVELEVSFFISLPNARKTKSFFDFCLWITTEREGPLSLSGFWLFVCPFWLWAEVEEESFVKKLEGLLFVEKTCVFPSDGDGVCERPGEGRQSSYCEYVFEVREVESSSFSKIESFSEKSSWEILEFSNG
jgi:hypothetical protein